MKSRIVSVLLMVAAAASFTAYAELSSRAPVAGTDYTEIRDGTPLDPADGKVVVEEFFNYACPGCDGFEPVFTAWTAQMPSWVKIVRIPAAFRPDFVPYARAYYAAEALGIVGETHHAVYDAIHRTHQLPGEGARIDEKKIAAFYANYGVSAEEFLSTMQGFAVDSRVRRAAEYLRRCKIPSTPSLVIDGRYLVRGKNYNDTLRIANSLIKMEHERMAANPPAGN